MLDLIVLLALLPLQHKIDTILPSSTFSPPAPDGYANGGAQTHETMTGFGLEPTALACQCRGTKQATGHMGIDDHEPR